MKIQTLWLGGVVDLPEFETMPGPVVMLIPSTRPSRSRVKRDKRLKGLEALQWWPTYLERIRSERDSK